MDKVDEIYNYISQIKYGWFDKDGDRHERLDHSYFDEFQLQDTSELKKSMCGVCWEQCELERELFTEAGIKNDCYFVFLDDGRKYPCHTFLAFELNDKFYWFEHAWSKYSGIHEYSSFDLLLSDVLKHFPEVINIKDIDYDKVYVFKYGKPKSHIGCLEYYTFVRNGELIPYKLGV